MSTPSPDRLILAEEYVLGLLDAEEAAALEAGLPTDAQLRRLVAEARERYHALDLTAPEEALPADLWGRIAMRIRTEGRDTVVPFARPAAAPPTPAVRSWSRGFLQGAAAAAFVGALAFGSLLAAGTFTRTEPVLIAVLLDEAAQPGAIVEAFGDDVRVLPLVDVAVPEDRTMQVWTLPSEDLGPVSLGLLPQSRSTALAGPDLPQPATGQLYEITLEPAGGSPTGRPTGPILFKGYAATPL